MKNYTLTLTEPQLKEIMNVVEIVARCKIGQFSQLLESLTDKSGNKIYDRDVQLQVENIIKPIMGLSSNASWGVGKFADADMLFDIYEVIRHHLSWKRAVEEGLVDSMEPSQRDWKTMLGVCYDTPFHWNKDVPLISIESRD